MSFRPLRGLDCYFAQFLGLAPQALCLRLLRRLKTFHTFSSKDKAATQKPYVSLDQVVVVRVGCRGSTRSKIEFCENVAEMTCDRLLAYVELVRNRLVGYAGRY